MTNIHACSIQYSSVEHPAANVIQFNSDSGSKYKTGPLHLLIYMQKLNKRVCSKRGKKYTLVSYREHTVPLSLQLALVVWGAKPYV